MNNSMISIVIPCYNAAETIKDVIREIKDSLAEYSAEYEVILINDGSKDNTFGVIRELVSGADNITGVDLARNFGQHSALMAGLNQCRGDIIVCMDDDGQTPADEIYKLIDKLEEGADIVYARYQHKKHSIFRNFGSYLNDLMARVMLQKPKDLFLSSFFCMRRYVLEEIIKYKSPYPYMMGLVLRTTDNIVNVDVNHRKREHGESGYTLKKLIGLWLNGFTAFSIKPLRIATFSGMILSVLGLLYGIWIIVKKIFFDTAPYGWSSLAAMIMFIGGAMMLMQGMIGEYIGRVYLSMNKNPQFVIRDIIGKDRNPGKEGHKA